MPTLLLTLIKIHIQNRIFFAFSSRNICENGKKCVPLHSLLRKRLAKRIEIAKFGDEKERVL